MPPPPNPFGIVYLLTNPSIPCLVKIGMTTRDNVESRMKELYVTDVPAPFERQYACKVAVSDCATIEKALHATERCIPNGMRVFRWVVAFSTERSIPIGMPQRDSIRNGVALDEVNVTLGKNNARVHMLHSDRNVTLGRTNARFHMLHSDRNVTLGRKIARVHLRHSVRNASKQLKFN